jgi:serine/threonine protein kinase/TolB-like protein
MNGERWSDLKETFAALVDLPKSEWLSRLSAIGAADPDLRARLESLLDADARAEALLSRFDLAPQVGPSDGRTAGGAADARGDGHPTESAPDPLGYAGRAVSHFRVLDVLGAGGMGVVYRAEDVRLGRIVALKFPLPQYTLDPLAKQRFLQEARAASALDHPNVCTVYEAGESDDGQPFLAMACYAGETLKTRLDRDGVLPLDDVATISGEILRALGAAHAAGVVHRDLKPGNVMLTTDGPVKILDFGLAKVRDLTITGPGQRPGTAAYMSPEQLQGNALDHRSDLWSLGVALYEMLTGRRPFGGGHELSTVYAILHEAPEPPSRVRAEIPVWYDAIVSRLLARNPDDRYPSAEAVLEDLDQRQGEPAQVPRPAAAPERRTGSSRALATALGGVLALGAGAALLMQNRAPSPATSGVALVPAASSSPPIAGRESIAVLPFVDMSPGKDQEYFSDGVTEEILNALAQMPELRVPARTSSFFFKGKNLPVGEIATALGVEMVLEGSVRRIGNRVRITAQLIDARADRHLWSRTLDGDVNDIFALQTQIARTVAEAMQVRLAGEWAANRTAPTASAVAHDLYLRGRYHWNRRTAGDLRRAIEFFAAATRIDSGYAQAYAGLALAYTVLPLSAGTMPATEALPLMEAAATRALQFDTSLAEVHAARGYSYHWNWRWADADREFRRALALNPNDVTSHQWYGEHLTKMGRSREGEAEVRRAIALDPMSLGANNDLGLVLFLSRRYPEAVTQLEKTRRMDSTFAIPFFLLHRVHLLAGDIEASARAGRRASELGWGNSPDDFVTLARATRDSALRPAALATLDRWKRASLPNWTDIAMYYALLGDRDRSIAALESGLSVHAPRLSQLKVSPWIDTLRGDPRFERIMAQLQFP